MTDTSDYSLFLVEYFSGMEKEDFYEEPVQGEYPDWQLQLNLSISAASDKRELSFNTENSAD